MLAAALSVPAISHAQISTGSISIGLQPVFNVIGTGLAAAPGIDMWQPGDGALYVATVDGKVVRHANGVSSTFLNLSGNANVPFTSSFAGGIMGVTFHPDYADSSKPGYRKFYTFSSDWKTTQQIAAGVAVPAATTVVPGTTLTGLPDFWHPEMYAPATSGNALTNWTNPDSPSTGNTDFDHINTIREWTANTDGQSINTAVAPRVVMRMAHGFQGKGSHNGGGLRFGADGYLYISTGDGGGNSGQDHDGGINNGEDGHTNDTGNAQDKTNVYGKVLRIDPIVANTTNSSLSTNGQYRIPNSNPFRDGAGGNVDELYAYGFRNPWKMNFDYRDGGDGRLYLGNVGQHHREEIDVIESGKNYGWGYMEGSVPLVSQQNYSGEVLGTGATVVRTPPGGYPWNPSDYKGPFLEYLTRRQYAPDGAAAVAANLVGDGTAVAPGFVYRGSLIPELYGMYVFGDYSIAGTPLPGMTANTGRIFYADPNAASPVIREFQFSSGFAVSGQLLGFGDDAQGELYAFFDNGNVRRIVAPFTWNGGNAGSWSTSASWIGGVPNAAGVRATFGPSVTAAANVNVDGAFVAGELFFSNANSYTLSGSGSISLQDTSLATLRVVNGSHQILTPISSSQHVDVELAAGTTLRIGQLTLPNAGNLGIHGSGTMIIGGAITPNTTTLNAVQGATILETSQSLDAVNIGIGALLKTDGSARTVLRSANLNINGGATPTAALDLGNDVIVLDYNGTSPETAVRNWLIAGRSGGAWSGMGINSSAVGSVFQSAVGYANAADVFNSFPATFEGESIDTTTLLVAFTLAGDSNLDRTVNISDFALLAANFGAGGKWSRGDYNYDGITDINDFALLAANFGRVLPAGFDRASVPEPTSLILAGGAMILARRHSRR